MTDLVLVRAWLIAASLALLGTAAGADVEHIGERRPLMTSAPDYPRKAREQRIEGDVTVCYRIDADGRVRRPYVKSTTHRMFNRAALKAARKTRYAPAPPGAANAVDSSCSTYRFRLQSARTQE